MFKQTNINLKNFLLTRSKFFAISLLLIGLSLLLAYFPLLKSLDIELAIVIGLKYSNAGGFLSVKVFKNKSRLKKFLIQGFISILIIYFVSLDFKEPWSDLDFLMESTFDETVKPELAHVFLGEYSKYTLRVAGKVNLGGIEGGETAIETEWLEKESHYYAAIINKFISPIKLQNVFDNYTFVTSLSSISYMVSGSFCRYPIEKFGIEKFILIYQTANIIDDYNKVLSIQNQNAKDSFLIMC